MNKLSDYIADTIDNRGRNPVYLDSGKYPVIDNVLIKNFIYPNVKEVSRYIDEETYRNFLRGYVHKNMPIMTLVGSGIGNVSLAPSDDVAIVQNTIGFQVKDNMDEIYLYYYLLNNQERIRNYNRGSGQPSVRKTDVLGMEVDIPNKETQTRIAKVLFLLDQKIQTNNEINDNLEEQALALFRHYFMDFAPYDGVVPSDWTEVSLDDVCIRITDGSHYSPADDPESPYPMYSVKDMEPYGFNSSSCKHISEEDFQKMQKSDCVPLLNDILVAKDGSYLKEIFICSEEKNEAILSSIAIFRPDTNIIIPEILLYLLKQPSVRKDVGDNYVSGSALPRIVLKDFKKYRFMLPPMDEQQKIGSVLHAIRMQTKANIDEIQCLSAMRDVLLPKLMTGELDVSILDL